MADRPGGPLRDHPHMLLRSALVCAFLVLAGCSETETGQGPCITAFREAEPRAGAPYQATALDDAVRRCGSLDEWVEAWRRVPAAHGAADDPHGFLVQRCAVPALAATSLCREVAGAS